MTFANYQRLSGIYDQGWGDFAGLYVQFLRPYLEERNLSSGWVLDLACGTGNLVSELAQAGYQVHGVDLSPEMVELARAKCADLANATFAVQDMVELHVEGPFDLVTCTFDSLNYLLHPEKVLALFRNVATVLTVDGLFVFDANTDQMYEKHHHGIHEKQIGDEKIRHILSYDSSERIATTRFEFANGLEEHQQRAYTPEELEELLEQAGFRLVDTRANFQGEEVSQVSERVYYVAELK